VHRIASLAVGVVAILLVTGAARGAQTKPPADPVFVLDTVRGTIEIRLFQQEAPKSVEHMLALIKKSFYRGQRFHRVEASLVQVGDPQSRDMSREGYWGTGGSGSPIGVFERPKTRKHIRGIVALGHSGNPAGADSQFYIMKAASPSLDGKYAIVGQVITGMAVVDRLQKADLIKNTLLK
jgi:cyclophilin family peptidyl-prolyl cis-trans isomerase